MTTAAAIASIRAAIGREFIPPEMFDPRASMAAPAKDPYLVNKIALLQTWYFQQRTVKSSLFPKSTGYNKKSTQFKACFFFRGSEFLLNNYLLFKNIFLGIVG
jgi:hypothetical protein